MNDRAQRFFDFIRGKRVSIVGVGVTNTDLVPLFLEKGALVTVHDKRSREQLGEVCDRFEALGAKLALGEEYLQKVECDVLLRTPGMYFKSEFLERLRQDGAVVTSEMEIFFDLCPCPTFAVTGSDGKTTTTTLIAEMLREAGYRVHLGGNIGKALLPGIEEITPQDMAVVELSSFQLISMRCAPDVSVVTNVAPNHLDVHKDMAEYIAAKRNIFLHQNAFSKTVLGLDNEITRTFQDEVRGRLFWFSRRERPRFGSYLADDGNLYLNTRAGSVCLMKREDIRLPGIHNVENYLAAIAAVCEYVTPAQMREVARTFGGVEHRIEFVRELQGVRWYNDSIATSPTRTIAGLRSFDQKLIIIAGGYDKKIPYLPLAPEINKHVKVLVLTGATAEKIEQAVVEHPTYDPSQLQILHAADLEEAVRLARAAAVPGDVVSLSPASASFDKYPNFEARGKHFKQLVNALQ
ncbi:UDP-N-acetylmuramoyl-L-alanine--D-glutamate ligase [Harryflintia acetispora]|uniref:UDP-N-acetylmuramoyl-L-alanine--D-glutamate ligase n=1 Tax=Harryflintia acetispora TaxID=1849041 RepID=UPI001898A573|nr:UDP-N-acetylmuramoyl-L-alanine--D-glutamate ligase [Harryflintia acetispora]